MAVLPGDRYLIQQHSGTVILFKRETEEEILRYEADDASTTAKIQLRINQYPDFTDEERAFAHFWSGYFYAHANSIHRARN